MLTPEQLDKLPDNLVRLYAQLEEDIIVNMAERINALNLFIPAADWQFQKVKELGNSYDMILEKLAGSTGKTEDMLSDMMTAAASESMKQDDAAHKAAGKNVPPLTQSAALVATLNAGMRKTAGYFENLCRTTAFNGSKQFADALDRAYMQVISGAFSKDEAIKSAVKDLAKQGITAAVYKDGRRMSLESAVRMNVITGINQTCAELQLQRADEVGCDLVAVSAHAGARPSHAEWQGKIFSRSGTHKKYPDFVSSTGYGTVTGLCGANCRHTFYPFYEGISVNAYTKKELDEMNRKKVNYNGQKLTEYEASQIQRKIERNIRRWKRENEAAKVIGIGTEESAAKLKYWRLEMGDFISQTGFKRQYAREDIFSKKMAKNTIKAADDVQAVVKIEKIIDTPKAKSIEEAKKLLVDEVGFIMVEDSVKKIDDALLIENTNQLIKLEKKFGAIHQSRSTICSVPSSGAAAYVSNIITNPTRQNLSLCPRHFSKKNYVLEKEKEYIESGFAMPAKLVDEELTIYTVTHEYGHMVQNMLIENEMKLNGWDVSKTNAFVDMSKRTRNAQYKWYFDIINKVEKDCFDEIIAIAKENNESFNVHDHISRYGKKNRAEFFAEVFVNSQLSEPNELGVAMNIWLEKKGLIK